CGAVAVAFGLPPAATLFRKIPRLGALPGSRLLGLADLSLAVLAGLGLTALERRRGSAAPFVVALVSASAAIAVGVSALPRGLGAAAADPLVSPAACLALLIVAAALSALVLAGKRPAVAASLLVALAVVDLYTFSFRHVPFVPAETVFPASPVL